MVYTGTAPIEMIYNTLIILTNNFIFSLACRLVHRLDQDPLQPLPPTNMPNYELA